VEVAVPEATPAPAIHEVPVDDLVGWLGDMIMIRRFEEVADDLSLRGKIAGGIHPAIGQEAVAVGTVRALGPEDVITGTHRYHQHALAKGLPPGRVLAELYGRHVWSTGAAVPCTCDFTRGLWGVTESSARGWIALGLARCCRPAFRAGRRGFFGDGGVNTGGSGSSSTWRRCGGCRS
jgi:pyruvate dehydrogenase E1 component alpha subunit